MKSVKDVLGKTFKLKDQGPASYLLGVQVLRDSQSRILWLRQGRYIETLLQRFRMEECNPFSTPTEKGKDPLFPSDLGEFGATARFRELMGGLCTLPFAQHQT